MKKLIMTVVGVLCLVPCVLAQNSYVAHPGNGSMFGDKQSTEQKVVYSAQEPRTSAGQFGLGIRAGVSKNDPKDLKEGFETLGWGNYNRAKLEKNAGVFGLEAFYEWQLEKETEKLGIKVGVDFYGENKLTLSLPGYDTITESTHAFPFTFYYKRDNGVKKWSWLVGLGMTIISSELEFEGAGGSETVSKTKVFPHITAGAEYRFSKLFALGLDVKYNISARVKKICWEENWVLSDRSGIGAAVTGRFYF